MFRVFTLVAVLCVASAADAKQLVRQFKGSGNTTTATFSVESPWIIDWRLDGDYNSLVALDVTLVDARSGRYVGRVLNIKRKGNGVRLFRTTGRFQLRISSTLANWTLKIEQLTEEEAELYKPMRP